MSAVEQLKALTEVGSLRLQEKHTEDVQRLWEVYGILGYTDEEVRNTLHDLANNECLRGIANAATDEHVREVNRRRRLSNKGSELLA